MPPNCCHCQTQLVRYCTTSIETVDGNAAVRASKHLPPPPAWHAAAATQLDLFMHPCARQCSLKCSNMPHAPSQSKSLLASTNNHSNWRGQMNAHVHFMQAGCSPTAAHTSTPADACLSSPSQQHKEARCMCTTSTRQLHTHRFCKSDDGPLCHHGTCSQETLSTTLTTHAPTPSPHATHHSCTSHAPTQLLPMPTRKGPRGPQSYILLKGQLG